MREYFRVASVVAVLAGVVAPVAYSDEREDARSAGPIFNVAHFDVIPALSDSQSHSADDEPFPDRSSL